MARHAFVSLLVSLAVLACGKDEAAGEEVSGGPGEEGGDSTTTFGSTTTASTTAGTSASTSTTTAADDTGPGSSGGEDEGPGFVLRPDGGPANECDPKVQDCPDGEKCTAWANDGGTFWNADKCVMVTGTGVAGDPCTVEGGGVSGVDDCALGFICLNTDMDGIGTCTAFCQGEDEDCNPGEVCAIYNDGVLPICLIQCDPILQDCQNSLACIDTPNGQFICFTDASGDAGAQGDPCPPEHGENSCDPGYWCGPGANGCVDVNCCTSYCDLDSPNCVSPDECVSFYGDPGAAPPGYESVGVCVLP